MVYRDDGTKLVDSTAVLTCTTMRFGGWVLPNGHLAGNQVRRESYESYAYPMELQHLNLNLSACKLRIRLLT